MKLLQMNILIWLFEIIFCNSKDIDPEKNLVGTFWQITDIHWDLEYSESGDVKNMCHNASALMSNKSTGHYGNYMCDSPYPLVNSALHAMKSIEPNPNFILWTGDNAPHTSDVNFPVIFSTIKNITEQMLSLFGSHVPIIPVLGNHDTYPKDDYPASEETFYNQYLQESNLKEVIPVNGLEDFKRGGYYKVELKSGLTVLVLNTNLYYRNNELGEGLADPAGQFEWMKQNLQQAKDTNTKVFIAAHAPPGYWERNPMSPFFNDSYNDDYVGILNNFGEQIIGQFYGHEHTDSFRIFGKSHEELTSVAFLAPSVSPWFPSRLSGATAINPSIRLYSYSTTKILDYVQYHMNLTEANRASVTELCSSESVQECNKASESLWKEYYKAAESFGVEALDVNGMVEAFEELRNNDTFFQTYFLHNSAGIEHGYCNSTCKNIQLCVISHQKVNSLLKCLNSTYSPDLSASTKPVDEGYSRATVLTALALIVLVISVGYIITLKILRRKKIIGQIAKGQKPEWTNINNGYAPLFDDEDDH